MNEETWKPVRNYEGLYEVSNLGRVRAVSRRTLDKSGRPHRNSATILQVDELNRVNLYKEGKYAHVPVRSLVGEAFLGVPYGEAITHVNGDITDARADNLVATRIFRVDDDWRDIPGFEGHYQASRYGEIRSLDRYIVTQGGLKFLHGVVRSMEETKDGYYQIALYKGKGSVTRNAHVFIAQAWIPNYDNKPTVNHKDGNKHNNNIENLEWATYSEQQAHAFQTGLRKKSYWDVDKHGPVGGDWNKSRQIRVRCIETGEEYESYSAAGEAVGQSATEIKRSVDNHCICKGVHFVKADEPDYDFKIADEDGEEWRDIPGWEGRYQVSNKHRVKSVQRTAHYANGRVRTVPEKIMKTTKHYTFHREGKDYHFTADELYNSAFPKKNLFKID